MSEEATQASTETTQTETTQPSGDIPAPNGAPAEVQPATSSPDAATPPTAYTPNYKFKALGQEHEFDEFVRNAVTNAEQEKRLREIYEKAHGLDSIKTRFNETRGTLQSTTTELNNIKGHLKELGGFIQNKDFGSMLKFFKIPENDMLEWAVQHAQRMQLPPEERQLYDARDEANQRVRELQKQNEYLMDQQRQHIASMRQLELDRAMGDQQVTDFASQFDARAGQAGAFQMEVARRGALHYQVTGQDLPPAEAVKQTLLALGYTGQPQGQQQAPQVATNVTQMQKPKQAATLPHIAGKASSPTKRSPKSLEDLHKLAAQARS